MPLQCFDLPSLDAAAILLAQQLAARGRRGVLDQDWLLVPSRPVAQWLTLAVARRAGACAGLDSLTPEPFLNRIMHLAGERPADDGDPWRRNRLIWRILGLLRGGLLRGDGAGYAEHGDLQAWQLADRLADRFDTWQLTRPDWLAAWAAGRDGPKHPHASWLGELWRALLAQKVHDEDRRRRLERALVTLRTEACELPELVMAVLTGPLPEACLDALTVLGERTLVLVGIVEPSPLMWGDVISPRRAARHGGEASGNPLLAALGGSRQRWTRLLEDREWRPEPAAGLERLQRRTAPSTVLAALQYRVAALEVPGEGLRLDAWVASADRSLRVHRCAGPRREVEVLRDEILRAAADLGELRPGDVLVLTPDLATYGPLIGAVFSRQIQGVRLEAVLADPPLAQADPVCAALLAVIRWAARGFRRSDGLALLDLEAIRAALAIDGAAAEALRALLNRAGVRRDLDLTARARRLGLPQADAAWAPGTWRTARDRLLAGWAAGDAVIDGLATSCGSAEPDAELLGRWTQWFMRVEQWLGDWQRPRPLSAWADALDGVLSDVLADDAGQTALATARQAVAGLRAGVFDDRAPLDVAAISAWLDAALAGEARLASGLDGRITVAELKPLRAVPARVIALLGMSEGQFPRRVHRAAFDPGIEAPVPGEHDPRGDDRQLFLDALLVAAERLIITAPGGLEHGERTTPAPLSPCVDELLREADNAVSSGERPSQALVVHHPLQPFSLPTGQTPTTFDREAMDLARLLVTGGGRSWFVTRALIARPMPEPPACWTCSVDDLVLTLRDPARVWLQQVLGGALPADDDVEADDDEPLSLERLAKSQAQVALIIGGISAFAQAHASAALPLGRAGASERAAVQALAEHFRQRIGVSPGAEFPQIASAVDGEMVALPGAWPRRQQWRLPERFRLTGSIPGRLALGSLHTWLLVNDAALTPTSAKHWLSAAVRHLVLSCQVDGPLTTRVTVIAKDDVELPSHGVEASARLGQLMAIAWLARHWPLPFAPGTSHALQSGKGAVAAWHGDDRDEFVRGEAKQRANAVVWRGSDPLRQPGLLRIWNAAAKTIYGLLLPGAR